MGNNLSGYKENILSKLKMNEEIDNILNWISENICWNDNLELKLNHRFAPKFTINMLTFQKALNSVKDFNDNMINRYMKLSFQNSFNSRNKMKIIGIAGKSESGKTTFANMLKEELELRDKKVLMINYGDFVKFIAKQYYNWNGEKDEGGRTLLQRIGTDQGRDQVDKNLWVDMVMATVKIAENDFDVAIIADTRFPNEFDRWSNSNYDILKIKMLRFAHENILTEEQKHHLSETSLDNYNDETMILVQNEGNLEDLKQIAKQIVKVNF